MSDEAHRRMNLAFGGGIFLGTYQLGVAKAFYNNGQALLDHVECYSGVSSGVIAAALLLLCPDKIGEYIAHAKVLADEIRKRGGLSPELKPSLADRLKKVLVSILPEDAYQKATGRLCITATPFKKMKHDYTMPVYWGDGTSWMRYGLSKGTTALDIFKKLTVFPENKLHPITEYKDNEYLINAIIGATYIPLWGGPEFPEFDDLCWMDAGFTNNLPRTDCFSNDYKTISISPYMGDNLSICPAKNINGVERDPTFFTGQPLDWSIWNLTRAKDALYPQSGETLHEYYEYGFFDTDRFLRRLVRD
ncbi:patatin-like phospholipase domain-containing protein 4 [Saccoglossus kowalevskii]|uniref:Patatin-like phospholipase domain-containing protein 1-like n=1 Tax=Saccoglossus kowalevskii TaxID=10224 RepID=A0ABM0GII2_SACKO|nr:PREDICTED: patatin-like phospholipase domain-containing protein 1-like [Saccoglossus kowalevskii]